MLLTSWIRALRQSFTRPRFGRARRMLADARRQSGRQARLAEILEERTLLSIKPLVIDINQVTGNNLFTSTASTPGINITNSLLDPNNDGISDYDDLLIGVSQSSTFESTQISGAGIGIRINLSNLTGLNHIAIDNVNITAGANQQGISITLDNVALQSLDVDQTNVTPAANGTGGVGLDINLKNMSSTAGVDVSIQNSNIRSGSPNINGVNVTLESVSKATHVGELTLADSTVEGMSVSTSANSILYATIDQASARNNRIQDGAAIPVARGITYTLNRTSVGDLRVEDNLRLRNVVLTTTDSPLKAVSISDNSNVNNPNGGFDVSSFVATDTIRDAIRLNAASTNAIGTLHSNVTNLRIVNNSITGALANGNSVNGIVLNLSDSNLGDYAVAYAGARIAGNTISNLSGGVNTPAAGISVTATATVAFLAGNAGRPVLLDFQGDGTANDTNGITQNTLTNNNGRGLLVRGFPNTTFLADVTSNTIDGGLAPNRREGATFTVAVKPTLASAKSFSLNFTDNVVRNSQGSGVAVNLQDSAVGDFAVSNNEITNSTAFPFVSTVTATIPNGLSLVLEGTNTNQEAANLLNTSVIEGNYVGITRPTAANPNGIAGPNTGNGIFINTQEASEIRDLQILNNVVRNNNSLDTQAGLLFLREDRSILRSTNSANRAVTVVGNTIGNNRNGVELDARNGSVDLLDFDLHNNFIGTDATGADLGNANDGITLIVQSDARLLVDLDNNQIRFNNLNGIHVSDVVGNFASDKRQVGGTWTNNTISDNTQSGILINGRHGLSDETTGIRTPLVIGLEGQGNDIENNGGNGIRIYGPLSGTVNSRQSTAVGEVSITNNLIRANSGGQLGNIVQSNAGIFVRSASEKLDIRHNQIEGNTGKGIDLEVVHGIPTQPTNVGEPGDIEATIRDNVITGQINGPVITTDNGDGIEVSSLETDIFTNFLGLSFNERLNRMDVLALNNFIDSNQGRGVDVLNLGNGTMQVRFGDNTEQGRNTIVGNLMDGFRVINTIDDSQPQDGVPVNNPSPAPNQAPVPNLGTAVPIQDDRRVLYSPDMMLDVAKNTIRDNGIGMPLPRQAGGISDVNGTGLVILASGAGNGLGILRGGENSFAATFPNEVGNNNGDPNSGNGRINMRVTDNQFEGNFGNDLSVIPYIAAIPPQTQTSGDTGSWPVPPVAFSITAMWLDPLVRINAVVTGNTGNGLDVIRPAPDYVNDESWFKSRNRGGGPFGSGTRPRNSTRLASDGSPFFPTPGYSFVFPGMDESANSRQTGNGSLTSQPTTLRVEAGFDRSGTTTGFKFSDPNAVGPGSEDNFDDPITAIIGGRVDATWDTVSVGTFNYPNVDSPTNLKVNVSGISPTLSATPGVVTFNFSEFVRFVEISDFRLLRDGIVVPLESAPGIPLPVVPVLASQDPNNPGAFSRFQIDLTAVAAVSGNYELQVLAVDSSNPTFTPIRDIHLQLNNQGNTLVRVIDGDGVLQDHALNNAFRVDTSRPVATISPVTPDPRNSAAGIVTVNFSEDVTGIDIADFELYRNDGVSTQPVILGSIGVVQVSPSQYTLNLNQLSGAPGTYELRLVSTDLNTPVRDIAGNLVAESFALGIASSDTWLVDTTLPFVTSIGDALPPDTMINSPVNVHPGSIVINFSEAVSGVDNSDFTLLRTNLDGTIDKVDLSSVLTYPLFQLNPGQYELNLLALPLVPGTYRFSINTLNSGIVDTAGNAFLTSFTASWILDVALPIADIVDVAPDPRQAPVDALNTIFTQKVNGVNLANAAAQYVLAFDNGTSATAGSISDSTNSGPIVVTSMGHNLANGERITVYGVQGNTNTNGVFLVQNVTPNTFELTGSSGSGIYTSGGRWVRTVSLAGLPVSQQTDTRYVLNLSTFTLNQGTYIISLLANSGITDDAGNAIGPAVGQYNVSAQDVWSNGPDAAPMGTITPITTPRGTNAGVMTVTFSEPLAKINNNSPVDAKDFKLTRGGAITSATNAAPIVITSTKHGLQNGEQVTVSGVLGNLAANGTFTVTVVDANRFSLNGSTGNGAYVANSGNWAKTVSLANVSITQTGPMTYTLDLSAAGLTDLDGNYTLQLLNTDLLGALATPLKDLTGNLLSDDSDPLTAVGIANEVVWVKTSTLSGPQVSSFIDEQRGNVLGSIVKLRSVQTLTINFSEAVTGIDLTDASKNFLLTRQATGGVPIPVSLDSIAVQQVTPSQYRINLSTLTGTDGTYAFKVLANDLIKNLATVPLKNPQTVTWVKDAVMRPSTVADSTDSNQGNEVVGAGSSYSLRQAIQEANELSGDDVIELGAGTYTLSLAGVKEDFAAIGDLDIRDNLVIRGRGVGTTIIDATALSNQLTATNRDRLFQIMLGVTVTIQGVTIQKGAVTNSEDGGAIRNAGNLTILDSLIQNNSSQDNGGAINNTGTLTINRTTISGNTATLVGGAIRNAGTLLINNSTLSGNSTTAANGHGGALMNVTTSTATLENVTVSGNLAQNGAGGGIRNDGTLRLINDTIAFNKSLSAGAGISRNLGTVTIGNTIVSDNTLTTAVANDLAGTFVSIGGNLVRTPGAAAGFIGTDQLNANPNLQPLGNNGGPTQTHALLLNSPAIDRGLSVNVTDQNTRTSLDQRGALRFLDGPSAGNSVDVGAIEFGTFFVNTTDDSPDVSASAAVPFADGLAEDGLRQTSLRAAIMESNLLDGESAIMLDGQVYSLKRLSPDKTPPTVFSITGVPLAPITTGGVGVVTITFSERVAGVDLTDIVLTRTTVAGGPATPIALAANLFQITKVSDTVYKIENKADIANNVVNTGLTSVTQTNGFYNLNLLTTSPSALDANGFPLRIRDIEDNTLKAQANVNWVRGTDTFAPTVTMTADSAVVAGGGSDFITNAGSVTVTFSEKITGVSANNFTLTRNGAPVLGLVVTPVTDNSFAGRTSVSLNLQTLTAAYGNYVLTLNPNFGANVTIKDSASNNLGAGAQILWAKTANLPTNIRFEPINDPRVDEVTKVRLQFTEKVAGVKLEDFALTYDDGSGIGPQPVNLNQATLSPIGTLVSVPNFGNAAEQWELTFSNKQAARDGVYSLSFDGLTNGNQLVTTATTAINVVNFTPTTATLPFQIGEDQARIGDLDVVSTAGRVRIFGKGKDNSTTVLGNPQSRTVIDGNLTDRLFDLAIGADVSVSGVEMLNGKVVYERSGGAFRNFGSLTLNDDDLLSNFADGNGGAIYNAGPFGLQVAVAGSLSQPALVGDILLTLASVAAFPNTTPFVIQIDSEQIQVTLVNAAANQFTVSRGFNSTTATAHAVNSPVTLLALTTINRSNVQNNVAGSAISGSQFGKGGAIFNEYGAVTINEGTYSANSAVTDGGAIYNGNSTTASLLSTTFNANLAGRDGGAIYNNDTAILSISVSTLSNNKADAVVSGIVNDLNGDGGAIYNENSAKLFLDDNLLQSNSARNGGALYNDDGTLVLNRNTFGVNSALENGGAIVNTSGGSLTLNQGLFTTNSASDDGGAIQNFGVVTVLDVAGTGTQFLSNEAGTDVRPGDANNGVGGAIYNRDGKVDIHSATFTLNRSHGDAGVIYNDGNGTLTIQRTTFDRNSADGNGGVLLNNDTAQTTINEVTFSNNTATGDGGAIDNNSEFTSGATLSLTIDNTTLNNNKAARGGAIFNSAFGGVTMTNSTLAANAASVNGGGIANFGTVSLLSDTLFLNTAPIGAGIANNVGGAPPFGPATLKNTLVAGGSAGADIAGDNFVDGGHNLIEDVGTVTAFNNVFNANVLGQNPQLDILRDNGGPTKTHALLFGSPARDAGDNFAVTLNDQRGLNRVFDGDGNGVATVDIGSFESGFVVNSFLDTVDQNPGDGINADKNGQSTLRAAIMEANARPGEDTIILGPGIFTLTLPGRHEDFRLNSAGNIQSSSETGDLDVLDDLNIIGAGTDLTFIDAAQIDRIFQVFAANPLHQNGPVSLKLSNLTLLNGNATSTDFGGAIYNQGATSLSNVLVINSSAGRGGGIYNDSTGTLTITNSLFRGNQAVQQGGAIYNDGSLTMTLSDIGAASRLAAAITSAATTVTLSDVSNFPTSGPFVIQIDAERMLVTSILGNNLTVARAYNGTVATAHTASAFATLGNVANIHGGGVFNLGIADIQQSSFSGNLAQSRGGGLYNAALTGQLAVVVNNLQVAVPANALQITLVNAGNFPNVTPFTIQVDSEQMTVTAVAGNVFTVTRAANSTVAANHALNALVTLLSIPATSTTITLNSVTAFPAAGGFNIQIDFEKLLVTAVNPLNNTLTVQRGILQTGAAVHSTGVLVASIDQNRATISQSTFLDNFASSRGAAIYNEEVLTIQNSTLSNNDSGTNAALGNSVSGQVTIENSTVVDNVAFRGGGLANSLIGTVNVHNTIVANNASTSINGAKAPNVRGTFATQGNNFIGNNADSLGFTNNTTFDQVGSGTSPFDPVLKALADNGGPTLTHTARTGSPIIDNANNTGGAPVDQRGAIRPTNSDSDIGAVEQQDVHVSINDVMLKEGNSGSTIFTFTLSLTKPSIQEVRVHYTLQGDTAFAGEDFVDASGDVVFAPNQLNQTLQVVVNGDTTIEPDEQFLVNLSIPDNASFTPTLDRKQAVGTILSDDTGFRITDYNRVEKDAGSADQDYVFTVSVVGAKLSAVPGKLRSAADAVTTTLSLGSVADFPVIVPFTILVDAEQMKVTAVNAATNDFTVIRGINGTVAATHLANATVNRTFIASYSIIDGSATIADGDYALVGAATGTFTFTAGPNGELPAGQTITVKVKGDNKVEANENFFVKLTSVDLPFEFGKESGVGTIFNDDLGFTVSNASVVEGDPPSLTPMNFVVSLQQAVYVSVGQNEVPTLATTTASISTASGTATSGQDFQQINGQVLTFSGPTTSQVVPVQIIGDLRYEVPSETFQLQVTGGTVNGIADANVVGFSNSGTGTIVDNDPPPDQYHFYTQRNSFTFMNHIRVDRIHSVAGLPVRDNLLDVLQAGAAPISQVGDFGAVTKDDLFVVDFNLYDDNAAAFTQYDNTGVIDATHVLGNSNPIPAAGGISVDGQNQVGADALRFQGGSLFNSVEYNSTNPGTGSVVFDGTSTVSYTGLEPLFDNTNATNRVFNAPLGASNDTIFTSASSGFISISGPTFESVTALAPTNSLTLNSFAGNDVFQINSSDQSFTASLTVNAGDGNDSVNLAGWALSSTIIGGLGNDTITGGSGNDSIDGGDGNDTITGGLGNDTLLGGIGTDSIAAGGGDDSVVGGDDNDTIQGNDGIDTIFGGAGNDSVDGGAGSETVDGGSGNDTVNGGDGDDTVLGNDGNDLLSGGTGNDSLDGGFGDDTMTGDAGNDTINGQNGVDQFNYTDASSSNLNFTLSDSQFNAFVAPSLVAFETDTLLNTETAFIVAGNGNNKLDATSFTGSATMNGAGGNDTLIGGSGSDSLIAGAGNDTVNGGPGNDTINGGDGNDTLSGGTEDDSITGDAGTDSIDGGIGNDYANGGTGNDTLTGGTGDDTLDGGNDNDTITGGDGKDSLLGGAGQDSINGNDGNDTIDGGDGDDTAFGDNGNDYVGGGSGNDTLQGNLGDDSVNGNDGNDTLDGGNGTPSGNTGFDTLFGGEGDDSLISDDGNDQLLGQGGSKDSFTFNADPTFASIFTITATTNGNPLSTQVGIGLARLNLGTFTTVLLGVELFTLNMGSGNDLVTLGDLTTVTDLTALNIVAGDGNDTIDGSLSTGATVGLRLNMGAGNDSVLGTGAADTIDAGTGNDTIIANGGADSVIGGGGNDSLNGNDGIDTINGGLGDDSIWGGGGADSLIGLDGKDTIWGQAGNDTLDGGLGDDSLDGGYGDQGTTGTGNDSIIGGWGNDKIAGRDGNDTLVGDITGDTIASGADTIVGGEGNDKIDAGNGNDLVEGDNGNDTINGGAGNDFLLGGSGNDSILGGSGNDTLVGEAGDDTVDGQGGTDTVLGGLGLGTDTHSALDKRIGEKINELFKITTARPSIFNELNF